MGKKVKETNKLPTLTEYQEQVLTVQYLDTLVAQGKVVKYTAIPNSTWTPSFAQKAKNKKMGLRPGFPDLFILFPQGAVCIEMKRTEGSVTSKEQWEWIEALEEHGIPSHVAFGFTGAKEVIDTYL